jgi:predicted dehydrogenase
MIVGMRATRVAVIGAGFMGERHARIYAGLPDVELVAVCDARESVARDVAALTGAAAHYADFAELLRRDDLDAVSVCTPDGLHREPCELALRGGRHVLVEKPTTTTT